MASVTLQPFAIYAGAPQSIFVLVSLLVCLIPTTIGGLLSAIGIAGMDRLIQHNVLAIPAAQSRLRVMSTRFCSTRPVRLRSAIGRQRNSFRRPELLGRELANAAQLSSLADETPEGRSIVVLAKEEYGLRGRELSGTHEAQFMPFSAQTRMSGDEARRSGNSQGSVGCDRTVPRDEWNVLPDEVRDGR